MNRTGLVSIMLVAALESSAFVAAPLAAPQAPPAAPVGPAAQGRGPAPVRSPEVGADGRVTFRLRAPNASEVAVAIGEAAANAERRAGPVESYDRSDGSRHLHLLVRG